MRRRNKRLNLILFAATTIAAATLAGPALLTGQQSKPDEGDAVFSSETRLVPLNVTVTDKNGHLITNLPQSAFSVLRKRHPAADQVV